MRQQASQLRVTRTSQACSEAAVGSREVPNPVCTIREGFLKEVITQMARGIEPAWREGRDRRKALHDRISDPRTCN